MLTIHVTQEDIDKSLRLLKDPSGNFGRATHCPIGLASTRATGMQCFVSEHHISLVLAYHARLLSLPPSAVQFVKRFDKGVEVAPFSFELDIP